MDDALDSDELLCWACESMFIVGELSEGRLGSGSGEGDGWNEGVEAKCKSDKGNFSPSSFRRLQYDSSRTAPVQADQVERRTQWKPTIGVSGSAGVGWSVPLAELHKGNPSHIFSSPSRRRRTLPYFAFRQTP